MQAIGVETRRAEVPATLDRDWGTVAASGICLMLSEGTLLLYSFGVFVRPLTKEFHWTRTQVSGALSVGQFTIALTGLLWGYLLDRFGPRKVIVPSVISISIMFGSLALLTPPLWHLYLVFCLFCLLGGAASPIGYAAVLVRGFNRHLGLALGLAMMGIGLGAAFLPSIAQELVSHFGWRTAYGVLGLATLVITLPSAIFATRHARTAVMIPGRRNVPILPMVMTRAFLLMCAIFVLLGAASGGVLAHLVPMMIDRGFNPRAAASVAGLAGIAVIVGRGGIGWLLDRFNAARLLSIVAVLVICSLLLLLYAKGDDASYLAALLIGSVLGAEVDFTAFLVRRYFGNEAFGRLYGLAFGIFVLGTGVGPLLLGMSFDRFGSYHAGLLLFVGLALVSAVATFAMPRYEMPSQNLRRG